MNTDENISQLDHAVSERLAKLAGRAVDTSHIARQLDEHLEQLTEPGTVARSIRFSSWWRPVASAAAIVALVLTIGWLAMTGGTSTAVAAPMDLARIHYDVTRGLEPHLTVSSVAEANRLLSEQADGTRPLPENLPGQFMSCCLHEYEGTTLCCVLLKQNDDLITVAVADGAKMRTPQGENVTRNGREFVVHHANGINMVMAYESGRWLCVMGDVPIDDLLTVAASIEM